MAEILTFPRTLFDESPTMPIRTSPSAEKSALNRPRLGLHAVNRAPRPSIVFHADPDLGSVVAHIDVENARKFFRNPLRRIFGTSTDPDNWPQTAA
jgi:hypothetical protein